MKGSKKFSKYGSWLVRIVVGLIFVLAGYGKLFGAPGIAGFSGMLAGIGFPASTLLTWIVALVELIGGLAVIAGVGVQYASILLSIVIVVAILTVHLQNGWLDYRYPLLLLVSLVSLAGKKDHCSLLDCFKK